MGKTSLVFVIGRGVCQQLEQGFPTKHGVEDDNHTKHSGSLLPSRVQKQIKNHHTLFSALVSQTLVAHSSVFHQPEVCERSKTSKKKLGAKRLISGDWFANPKGVNPPSVSYTSVQGAASYRTRSMSETVLI